MTFFIHLYMLQVITHYGQWLHAITQYISIYTYIDNSTAAPAVVVATVFDSHWRRSNFTFLPELHCLVSTLCSFITSDTSTVFLIFGNIHYRKFASRRCIINPYNIIFVPALPCNKLITMWSLIYKYVDTNVKYLNYENLYLPRMVDTIRQTK